MQFDFVGRNIDVTPALKTFTQEKFQHLARPKHTVNKVTVVFHIEHLTHTAEATMDFDHQELHAKAEAEDMYFAIDKLVAKLTAQVNKIKDKYTDHR